MVTTRITADSAAFWAEDWEFRYGPEVTDMAGNQCFSARHWPQEPIIIPQPELAKGTELQPLGEPMEHLLRGIALLIERGVLVAGEK